MTQDGSQAYFGSKLKGTQCECFGGWGLPLSWVGEAVLALLTKQWRSGQKSELILSSKHRLSLLFFSPLYPLGLSISFKGNSYSPPRTPLPDCQVGNFNRFFKVTEPQGLLPRGHSALSTSVVSSSFL